MWPDYNFLFNEKTMDAVVHKMKKVTIDVVEMQVETASKMFGLANKHTDNIFGLYENVFNKHLIDYRNTMRDLCKE